MSPNLTHSKRFIAMAWFSAFSIIAPSLFFYPLSMTSGARVLFFGLPASSAAIAGYVFGGNLIDRTKTPGYGSAILKGTGVALGAFVIFAVSLPILERGWAFNQIGSLFVHTLIFGFLNGGPLTVIARGIAGASLYWVGSLVRA